MAFTKETSFFNAKDVFITMILISLIVIAANNPGVVEAAARPMPMDGNGIKHSSPTYFPQGHDRSPPYSPNPCSYIPTPPGGPGNCKFPH